jgi:hypothetical protein
MGVIEFVLKGDFSIVTDEWPEAVKDDNDASLYSVAVHTLDVVGKMKHIKQTLMVIQKDVQVVVQPYVAIPVHSSELDSTSLPSTTTTTSLPSTTTSTSLLSTTTTTSLLSTTTTSQNKNNTRDLPGSLTPAPKSNDMSDNIGIIVTASLVGLCILVAGIVYVTQKYNTPTSLGTMFYQQHPRYYLVSLLPS